MTFFLFLRGIFFYWILFFIGCTFPKESLILKMNRFLRYFCVVLPMVFFGLVFVAFWMKIVENLLARPCVFIGISNEIGCSPLLQQALQWNRDGGAKDWKKYEFEAEKETKKQLEFFVNNKEITGNTFKGDLGDYSVYATYKQLISTPKTFNIIPEIVYYKTNVLVED